MPINNPSAAAPPLTKELWAGAALQSGVEATFNGDYIGCPLLINEIARVCFFIPWDFVTIIEAVLMVIPNATNAVANWDIASDYAAPGEAKDIHSEADAAATYDVTLDEIFEVDVSGILSNLSPGDYVGIRLMPADVASNVHVIGLRFRYA